MEAHTLEAAPVACNRCALPAYPLPPAYDAQPHEAFIYSAFAVPHSSSSSQEILKRLGMIKKAIEELPLRLQDQKCHAAKKQIRFLAEQLRQVSAAICQPPFADAHLKSDLDMQSTTLLAFLTSCDEELDALREQFAKRLMLTFIDLLCHTALLIQEANGDAAGLERDRRGLSSATANITADVHRLDDLKLQGASDLRHLDCDKLQQLQIKLATLKKMRRTHLKRLQRDRQEAQLRRQQRFSYSFSSS